MIGSRPSTDVRPPIGSARDQSAAARLSSDVGPLPIASAPVDPAAPATIASLLRTRAARRSVAPHPDGARIALAVEGGGMRAVVSAGMVSALETLGLTYAFDAVFGSSAGALNGAYFLASQAAFGATIYSEDINNRAFIDLSRPIRGRPILDLEFLLDDIARARKKLDTERVLSSPTPLYVLATDVETAGRTVLTGFADSRDLVDALRAGARMPVIAGDPVSYRGRRYLDASLSEPIPVAAAEETGFTHILVLLTRPDEPERRLSWFDRLYVLPRLRAVSPELARRYRTRFGPYASMLATLRTGVGPGGRAITLTARPAGPPISKLERHADVLLAGAARGRDAVLALFA